MKGHRTKYLHFALWCLLACAAVWPCLLPAQSLVKGEYFFNEDPGVGQATPVTFAAQAEPQLEVEAPVGSLQTGYHRLYFRFQSDEGRWGPVAGVNFFITGFEPTFPEKVLSMPLATAEYFWNEDPGPGNGEAFYIPAGNAADINFAPQAPAQTGTQLLGLRVRDLRGTWGVAKWVEITVAGEPGLNTPTAAFSYSPAPAEVGLPATFTDESLNVLNGALIQWDIDQDDVTDYTGDQIFHAFTEVGIYPVRQTVVNPPSALAQTAISRFYFTNGSLADEAGAFAELNNPAGAMPVTGRQGDMLGAFATGPALLTGEGDGSTLNNFSVSFWFRGSSGANGLKIGESNQVIFEAFSNPLSHTLGGVSVAAAQPGTPIYNAQWQHFAVVYENDLSRSYLNGNLVASTAVTGFTPFSLDALEIGVPGADPNSNGTFDDLLIFDRALNPVEVLELYNEVYASTYIENVLVGPLPNLELQVVGETEFCSGDEAVLVAPNGLSFYWNTGETSQTITVTESGLYACLIETDAGFFSTEAADITVFPTPITTLTTFDASNGQSNGSAGATIQGISSFQYSYDWSTGSSLPSISGLAAGDYSVLLSDGRCPVSYEFQIEDLQLTPPIGVQDAEYFFGEDPGPGNGLPLPFTPGDSTGTFAAISLEGLDVGIHRLSVRVRNSDGSWSTTRSRQISINTPTEDPFSPITEPLIAAEYFFDDEDPGPGNANPIASFAAGFDIDTDFSASVQGLSTGQHRIHVRFKDEDGSWGITRSEIFNVEVILPPTLPEALSNFAQAEYFIGSTDPGVGNAIPIPVPHLVQLDLARTIDVSGMEAGEYLLSVRTKDVGRQWSITKSFLFEIIEVECPVPNVNFNFGTATAGVPLQLINASSNPTQGTTVAWDINANGTVDYTSINATHTFPAPGVYDVALTINNGAPCNVTVIKQVEVGPVPSNLLLASGPTEFCDGGSVTLTASAGSNYLWNTYEETPSIVVSESGVYQCAYTDINGTARISGSVEVIVYPRMQIELTVNDATNGAPNGSAGLLVSGGSSFIYSYEWSNGNELPLAANLLPGTYTASVDDGVCPEEVSIIIGNVVASGDEDVLAAEYFWGLNDPGTGMAVPILLPQSSTSNAFSNIVTDSLEPGYNLLSLRAKLANGSWGITRTIPVMIADPSPEVVDSLPSPIVFAEYFLDQDDPGPGQGTPIVSFAPDTELSVSDIIADITEGLEAGPHEFNIRTKAADGTWSITRNAKFFIEIVPHDNLADLRFPIIRAEYFIGPDDPGLGNGIPVSVPVGEDVSFAYAIDLTGFTAGTYRVTLRVQDVGRHWSVAKTSEFEVVPVSCPVPVVSFTASAANPGQNSSLVSTSSNVLPGASYSWDFNADGVPNASGQSAQLPVPSAGTYFVSLTVDNGDGCISSATQELNFGAQPNSLLSVNGPEEFCEGGSITLTAPVGSNYVWPDGSVNQSFTTNESGAYSVAFTSPEGLSVVSNTVNVTVRPTLAIDVVSNPSSAGLPNGSAGVLVSGGSTFLYDYAWSSGETEPIIVEKTSGLYTVDVSDPFCPETVAVEIAEIPFDAGVSELEYFWGQVDPGVGLATQLPVSQSTTAQAFGNIPTDGFTPGYYLLNIRARDQFRGWGITRTLQVYLGDPDPSPPDTPGPPITALEYFFDEDPGIEEGVPLSVPEATLTGGEYELSAAGLAPGEHVLSVRARNTDGEWSITRSKVFNTCSPPDAPQVSNTLIETCAGDDVTITALDQGFTLTWVLPDSSTISGTTVEVSSAAVADEGVYTVRAESDPGCFSAPTGVELNILNPPVITSLISGPPTICNETDDATLFISPIENATIYNWLLPEGSQIISGNNTNNVAIDFSEVGGSSAIVLLAVANQCGTDTSSSLFINFECEPSCNVVGGTVSAIGNLNPCVGFGEPGIIQLSVSGNVGSSRFGIVTQTNDIVAVNNTGIFDMNLYPPGTYRMGHLSFGEGFSLSGVNNVSQFTGCYSISNLIVVNSYSADGGSISANGPTSICKAGGPPNIIPFSVSSSIGPNKRWVVLNMNLTEVFAISSNSNFNWNNFPVGQYRVLHVAYANEVNLNELVPPNIEGCVSISNRITVTVANCPGQLSVHPNPSSGISNVEFVVTEESTALLELYDLSGRLISTLYRSMAEPELEYRVTYDASHLPNGVYLYRLTTDSEVLTEKFMLAR